MTPREQRRADLLRHIERWTYGRKIQLCAGLRANVVSVSDAILAHGLSEEEIDRWMEAYKEWSFEALKVGNDKKRRRLEARCPPRRRDNLPPAGDARESV